MNALDWLLARRLMVLETFVLFSAASAIVLGYRALFQPFLFPGLEDRLFMPFILIGTMALLLNLPFAQLHRFVGSIPVVGETLVHYIPRVLEHRHVVAVSKAGTLAGWLLMSVYLLAQPFFSGFFPFLKPLDVGVFAGFFSLLFALSGTKEPYRGVWNILPPRAVVVGAGVLVAILLGFSLQGLGAYGLGVAATAGAVGIGLAMLLFEGKKEQTQK